MNKTLGISLCVLGVIGLGWGGFIYRTPDKVFNLGSVHVTHEETHRVPLPPLAGGLALIGGVVFLVAGRGKGTS